MFTVTNTTHILIFNTSANYSLCKSIVTNSSYEYFTSLYFGSYTYLYIARRLIGTNTVVISQYDLQAGQYIHELDTNVSAVSMEMVHNTIFQYEFSDTASLARGWYPDKFHYAFNGTNCYSTYTYQSFTNYINQNLMGCVKTGVDLLVTGGYSNPATSIGPAYPYAFYAV